MNSRPSLFRILTTDYASLSGVVLALGIWVFFLIIYYFSPELGRDYAVMAVLVSPLGLVILLVRVPFLLSVLRHGQRVRGEISGHWFLLERGRLTYEYNFLGQNYTTSNMVYKSKRTQRFDLGERVDILVDPDHPEQAFLQELYTRPA